MSVVGPIAAKKLQGRECSEVFWQQNSSIRSSGHTDGHQPFAERNLWNSALFYSGLMLAARITLPHFSVSSAMRILKSAGEPARIMPPRSAS